MPAINKLSDRKVQTLKPADKEQVINDGGGLYLRVYPSDQGGAKVWFLRYKFAGKVCRFSLGPYPALSLASAREKRNEAQSLLVRGINPAEHTSAKDLTLRQVADLWKSTVLHARHKDHGEKVFRMLEHNILKKHGATSASAFTYERMIEALEAAVGRGSVATADKLLSWSKQMFGFAYRRRLIADDPTEGIRSHDVGARRNSRSTTLSLNDIKYLSAQMPEAKLPPMAESAFWILLGTGARSVELRKSKCSDFDVENRVWTIPEENSKNGKTHTVYVSDFVLPWVQYLMSHSNTWLMPGRGDGPVSDEYIRKIIGARSANVHHRKTSKNFATLSIQGVDWTIHDPRRTMATRMGDLGVLPHVIEACLNHTPQGTAAVYLRQQYWAEKVAAWKLWGTTLNSLVRRTPAGW